MMTVRLRIAAMLASWLVRDRNKPVVAASRLPLRCVWTDCDINRHMNNSRYLALMDLGRWHFLLVTGLWRHAWERGWAPVAVRVEIDYKKSLNPGDRFELETRVESYSTRASTISQRFWRGDTLCAEAKVVILWLHKGQVQEVERVFELYPHTRPASGLDEQVGEREAAHVS